MYYFFISFFTLLLLSGCSQRESSYNTFLINKLNEKQEKLNSDIQIIKENYVDKNSTEMQDAYIVGLKKSIVLHENLISQLLKDIKMLKESKEVDKPNVKKVDPISNLKDSSIETFDPSTFKTVDSSDIYSSSGEVINQWSKGTSFTSFSAKNDLYIISGYFKDHKWIASQEGMMIKKSSCVKR
jgi:hypothetical protein